jgi:hypothetical protein
MDWQQEDRDDEGILEFLMMELASSDEEEEEGPKHGGSTVGRAPNKARDFAGAHARLMKDYFNGTDSVYDEADFERRFRVPRIVFNLIYETLIIGQENPFVQKYDALGKPGISPLVRLTACFRKLAYGDSCDREDENLRLSQESLRMSISFFVKAVKKHFGGVYLNRCPSEEEKDKILAFNATRGFSGCFGSWDCKHFVWHRCPTIWAGQYKGHAEGGKKTLILEGVADYKRYIWYANFGDAGSLNDINVLDKSSIVGSMLAGTLDLTCKEYEINGRVRDWMYFLADGIYPEWAIFVKTFSEPHDKPSKLFATRQEEVRKDVECAFGIIVQKFQILQRPLRNWYVDDIKGLLDCCVILHNMTIAFQEDTIVLPIVDATADKDDAAKKDRRWPLFGGHSVPSDIVLADGADLFASRSSAFDTNMTSANKHFQLKADLTKHIFDNFTD